MSIQAMSWVIDNSTVGGSEYLVLLMVANYIGRAGEPAYASLQTLADDSRMSRRQVIRVVHQLAGKGELLIVEEGGPKGCNLYAIPGFGSDKMSPPPAAAGDMGGDTAGDMGGDIAVSPEPRNLGTVGTEKPLLAEASSAARTHVGDSDWDDFWQMYRAHNRAEPRRGRDAYIARLRSGLTHAQIMEATRRYLHDCLRAGRITKYAKTFLGPGGHVEEWLAEDAAKTADDDEQTGELLQFFLEESNSHGALPTARYLDELRVSIRRLLAEGRELRVLRATLSVLAEERRGVGSFDVVLMDMEARIKGAA